MMIVHLPMMNLTLLAINYLATFIEFLLISYSGKYSLTLDKARPIRSKKSGQIESNS